MSKLHSFWWRSRERPLENETDEERSVGNSDDLSFYSLPESESEEHNSQEEEEEETEMISSVVGPKSTSKSFRYDVNTPLIPYFVDFSKGKHTQIDFRNENTQRHTISYFISRNPPDETHILNSY